LACCFCVRYTYRLAGPSGLTVAPRSILTPERSSTPATPNRKLRFAQVTPQDVHVYESAPPSPKKSLFALPPPPAESEDRSDIVSLGQAKVHIPVEKQHEQEEGTPEDIRRRFFPSAAADNPDLEWMQTSSPSAHTQTSPLRFDLAGKLISQAASRTLPSHLGLHHHAEGTQAGYTLDDIFHLVRSTVPSQRAAMLNILGGVLKLVRGTDTPLVGNAEEEQALAELRSNGSDVVTKALFSALEALGERGGVGAAAVLVFWECVVGSDTAQLDLDGVPLADRKVPIGHPEVIKSIPMDDVLPQMGKVLSNPPDFGHLDTMSYSTTQLMLLSTLHAIALNSHANAEAISTASGLLPVILDVFIRKMHGDQIFEAETRGALHLFWTLSSTSRLCAQNIEDAGGSLALLRLVATSTEHEVLTLKRSSCLCDVFDIFVTFGRYGMLSQVVTTATELWRRAQVRVKRSTHAPLITSWCSLIETWLVCAADPHRTTPHHSLTWGTIQALEWGDDLVSLRNAAIATPAGSEAAVASSYWNAIAAWLEGSRLNSTRAGDGEREKVLLCLRNQFQDPEAWEAKVVSEALVALEQRTSTLSQTVPQCADVLASAMRLCLACCPTTTDPLPYPPINLPFRRIFQISAFLVSSNEPKHSPQAAGFLRQYLLLSRRIPDTQPHVWLVQAFCILLNLQEGDEDAAKSTLDAIFDLVSQEWTEQQQMPIPPLIWQKGGLQVLKTFFHEHIGASGLSPLHPTPQSIQECSKQRQDPTHKDAGRKSGLPLHRDWIWAPVESLRLLRSSAHGEVVMGGTTTDLVLDETDIARATVTFAKIQQVILVKVLAGGPLALHATMSREEIVFGCMRVFMLEHGLDEEQVHDGTEVFRDSVVSETMASLLAPYSLKASNRLRIGSQTSSLEEVAARTLGQSTPFYQFFSDFVGLYDAISFSHPLFGRLMLVPMSMAYATDYRRLFWCDFGHLARNLRVEKADLVAGDVSEYLEPVEENPDLVNAYLRVLVRYGEDNLSGFLRDYAVHHVASNIWPGLSSKARGTGSKLLQAVLHQCGTNTIRDIVLYLSANEVEARVEWAKEVGPDAKQAVQQILKGV